MVVAASQSSRLTPVPARRVVSRRWNAGVRRAREAEVTSAVLLAAVSVLCGVTLLNEVPGMTVSALAVPLVVGNIVLSPRALPWLVVFVLSVAVVVLAVSPGELLDDRRVGAVVVVFIIGLIILATSFRRTRLGVAGARGESMLVDLRDRISNQGQIPRLPADWYAEAVMRSAGGSSFAGDFMVSAKSRDGRMLQVVVVDVSGKGVQAGTRALLLSGAFGGLLGALPPAGFLPAANEYLLRQAWAEGFATAVHLSLDLTSGAFELRSAGHPPAVQLFSGAGRWRVHEAEGPVLGLIGGVEYPPVAGTVQRGDALLLYTDGLVETPRRDLSLGIDKLLGQAERLLRDGFERGANRLIDRVEASNDDRALMLLHRR